jgi:hypothetical protein
MHANVFPITPILVTLLMQALSSSETSVLTRATLRNMPEYAILPVFNLKTRFFGDWVVSCSSGGAYTVRPNRNR